MKSFRIWSFSGPYYPTFGVNTERYSPCSVRRQENTDKKNSEYGHLPRSEIDGYEMTHTCNMIQINYILHQQLFQENKDKLFYPLRATQQ